MPGAGLPGNSSRTDRSPAAISRGVIVGRKTSDDPLGANAQTLHGFSQRFERCARIGVGMLSAREAFFLIVADDPGTASSSHLDERNSGVVESADTYANEIGGFAAGQSCDQVPRPLGSELAVRTMNVFMPKEPVCKRQGSPEPRCRKLRVEWREAPGSTCISHDKPPGQLKPQRASGATHVRPPYLECQHFALLEVSLIDQHARPKAESVLFGECLFVAVRPRHPRPNTPVYRARPEVPLTAQFVRE